LSSEAGQKALEKQKDRYGVATSVINHPEISAKLFSGEFPVKTAEKLIGKGV
jgi:hypothetical protein